MIPSIDSLGRAWEWMFLAQVKLNLTFEFRSDFGTSTNLTAGRAIFQLNMHHRSSVCLQPYQHFPGRTVLVGPNMFLARVRTKRTCSGSLGLLHSPYRRGRGD